jgi:hypothetical protein
MDNEPKPNYFAVIPADVRYSDIPANAKLLYGEITALANKKGYCWAENKYFADLYKTTTRSVATWIAALKDAGFIEYVVENNNFRKISLAGGVGKKLHGGMKEMSGGYEENFQDTIYNNTPNKTVKKESAKKELFLADFEEVWSLYPRKVGKGGARKAWEKITMTAELVVQIKQSVEAHKKTDQWRESPKYIPHFATFLNQERWTDEVEVAPQQQEAIVI